MELPSSKEETLDSIPSTAEVMSDTVEEAAEAAEEMFDAECQPLCPLDFTGKLPKEFAQIAEKEIGETPEKREESLKLLKDLIRENDVQHLLQFDDDVLLMFLRVKKFEVDRAYKTLKTSYERKKNYWDANTFDYNELESLLSSNFVGISPYRDQYGRLVVLVKVSRLRVDTNFFDKYICMILQYGSKVIEDPLTQVCGVSIIIDCSGIDWRLLKFVTSRNVHLIKDLMHNCFPCRYKSAHLFNYPPIIRIVYETIRIFIHNKYQQRLFFHGRDVKSLQKHFAPCMLPEEFGGTIENMNLPYTAKEVQFSKLSAL